jgi:hypothetical protein
VTIFFLLLFLFNSYGVLNRRCIFIFVYVCTLLGEGVGLTGWRADGWVQLCYGVSWLVDDHFAGDVTAGGFFRG